MAMAALLAVLVACGSGDAESPAAGGGDGAGGATRDDPVEPIVATSGDIVFAVSIPDSALPEGVSRDDISIRATDPGTFELLPDGLQFVEPVTVSVQLPLADGEAVFAVLLSSDGSVEGLDLTIEPRENIADGTSVTFELEHFSFVLISSAPSSGIELSVVPPGPEDQYLLGESFTIVMRIDKKPWEEEFSGLRLRLSSIQGSEWSVSHRWLPRIDALEPGDSVGETTAIAGGQGAWIKAQTFTCVRPGEYRLDFLANVDQTVLWKIIDPSPNSRPVLISRGVDAQFLGECTLPPIVAVLSAPITTYTIDLPGGGDFKFAWSGADCGTTAGDDTNTYVWSHGEEGCEHAGEPHPGTPISLLIVTEKFEARCSYVSAASGTGPKCERTQ